MLIRPILTALLFVAISAPGHAQEIPAMDAELTTFQYPYPVHTIQLQIQGQQLHMAYMDLQPSKPNGSTILLLHGKNFPAAYWDSTAAELGKSGYRVIMPDQVGFGKSSKPAHLQYSFQLLAQNTKALLDTLHLSKVAVLGHSMGGMLATRFTLMYPDVVEKLILEDPIGLEDWKVKVPYQSVDKWYQGELTQNYEHIKKYQLDGYYGGQWKPAYDKWVMVLAGWTKGPDAKRIAWNNALTYDMIFTQPVFYEFENIRVPTLLIIGLNDRTALGKANVPEDVRKTLGNYPVLGPQVSKRIPGCKLVAIPGVGHLPHIQAFPQFIQPVLAFLAGS
ncbi:alpha/beta hydrolase [Chitinophaga sp.]|uniref:alpha/beta fold hydrolase n=1 Tax=Chitinophaga sp. TaxID=1869181 RepID=UPI0031E43964